MDQIKFVGSILSLDCGDSLGTFQGEVTEVNKSQQSISLKKPYRNGVKFDIPEITIRAVDIRDLKILKSFGQGQEGEPKGGKGPPLENGTSIGQSSTPNSKHKPQNSAGQRTPKKNDRQSGNASGKTPTKHRADPPNQNGSEGVRTAIYSGTQHSAFQRVQKDEGKEQESAEEREPEDKGRKQKYFSGSVDTNQRVRSSPRKIEGGQKQRRSTGANARNAECFSAPVESFLATDFDFDKSMKSFNKAAIFEEITSTMASGDDRKKVKNIPHNEDILIDNVPAFIHDKGGGQVKCASYMSESGVAVPAVSVDTVQRLFQEADKLGLTAEKRLEAGGVCITGMVQNLIDGTIRDKNQPTVTVVCGPHLQGAQGINCARHLANHNASVTLFIPNFAKMPEVLMTELRAFKMTDGRHITNVKDLPEEPPDLIISALDTPTDTLMSKQPWHKSIVSWVTTSKSSILSIDPTPNHSVRSKWSMITGLPLSYDNTNTGILFLCDIGIPERVFNSVGVEYTSPYKNKFVVRLHNR